MSNLLQKASIITTPTAYDTGKILSVKPVQTYGPELVTNGDFATDTDWTKGTGWTISGGKAISTSGGASEIYQSGGIVGSKSYLFTYEITAYTSGSVVSRLFTGTTGTPRSAVGVYQEVLYSVISNGNLGFITGAGGFNGSIDNVTVKEVFNADFDFSRNSSATRVGSNGLIQDVASNLPRIDYTGGVGSWKFEPQRTNLFIASEDFSTSWSQNNVLIDINQIISPNGTLDADLIKESSTNNPHFIFQTVGATTTSEYTLSVFAKYYSRFLQVFFGGGDVSGNPYVNFDLQNGTFNNVGANSVSMENYGNGWYKCTIIATSSVTSSFNPIFGLVETLGAARANSYQGDGTSGVYLWGAQLESGSYPTSYIRSNTGSATTRLADVANNAGSSDLINSTEGVLYAEISALADDGTYKLISLDNGSTSNTLFLGYSNNANKIHGSIISGGVVQFVFDYLLGFDIKLNIKIALKYKQNDFALFLNGFKIITDLSGDTPIGINNLSYKLGNGSLPFYGNTKSVAVFKEALTDLELECLVSWMSFSDLGINFGYTVE